MPKLEKVPLTTFVDFVLRSGTPKLTVVRNYKNRRPYDPATDFYKLLREAIVRYHQNNEPKKALDTFVATCHPKKQTNYVAAVTGYKKFLGTKKIEWFTPPTGTWSAGGITMKVNPELGLSFGGVKYAVKMYMKGQKLAPNRIETINQLMTEALSGGDTMQFGILDMREAKLHTAMMDPALKALLKGEAAAFATMLASV
jgi:hypothetical protein